YCMARELQAAAPEPPDLRASKPHLLKQHRPPITLDGGDVHEYRLARSVEHRNVVSVQFGGQPTTEGECPAKILRRRVGFGSTPQPHAEPPRMDAATDTRVVLKLDRKSVV